MNNFYNTLALASIFHKKVAGLYLIIELEKEQYIEFADSKDTEGQAKDHSIFRITLTKYPTEKDRNSVGFNEAFKAEDITNPIDGYLITKLESLRISRERNIKTKKKENPEIETELSKKHGRGKIDNLGRTDKEDKEIKSPNKQRTEITIDKQGEIIGTNKEIDQKDTNDKKNMRDKIDQKEMIGKIDKEEQKEKKINIRTELEEITEKENNKIEETIEMKTGENTDKNMNLTEDMNQKKTTEKETTKNLIHKKITKSNCFMI